MIIVAVAALIGGRLYHVIDQWQLYKDDPITIVLPPVLRASGVYGGIIAGTIAAMSCTSAGSASPFRRWAESSRRACSSCRRSAAGETSSTRSCTARRRPCRGASRSTAPTGSPTTRARVPARDDALPSAVPVRVDLGGHRRARPDLARAAAGVAAAPRRPAADLLHLVRGRPVRPRDAPHRQLDVLRGPDGAARDARVHPRRR